MNRIRISAKVAHIFKRLKYTYMTLEEVQQDLLNYSYLNKVLPPGYGENYSSDNVGIKVKLIGGHVELPFRFDWFARMIEFYGIEEATRYSIMIVQKWFS